MSSNDCKRSTRLSSPAKSPREQPARLISRRMSSRSSTSNPGPVNDVPVDTSNDGSLELGVSGSVEGGFDDLSGKTVADSDGGETSLFGSGQSGNLMFYLNVNLFRKKKQT